MKAAAVHVRRYLAARARRASVLPSLPIDGPEWRLLLDLFAAGAEGRAVSVTSACIAAGVPSTTGLRVVGRLERERLLVRRRDATDGRRTFVTITPAATAAVAEWVALVFEQAGLAR